MLIKFSSFENWVGFPICGNLPVVVNAQKIKMVSES